MSKQKRRNTTARNTHQPGSSRRVLMTGMIFFFVEVIFISGAYSPFRLPKMALALGAMALVVGSWSAVRLWRGRLELPSGPLVPALLALPALQAISAIWAQTPELALRQALFSAVWVAIAMWLGTFEAEDRHRILVWGVWGAVMSGVVLLAQLSDIAAATPQGIDSGDRLGLIGLAGNPSDLAMAALLFLPLLLPGVLAQPKRWTRWLLPAFLVVTAVLTQALTGLAAIGLVSLGFVALMRSKKAWGVILVLMAVAVMVISLGPLRSRIQSEWTQLQQGNWYNLLSAREDGWTAALTMIENSPILGVGAGQYSREFYPARMTWLDQHGSVGKRGELATHFEWAHNDPLQLTSELGLLGVLWMVFFVLALARSGRLADPVIVLAALVWTPFLLLHYPTHLAIGLIPAALLLAQRLHSAPLIPVLVSRPTLRRATAVVVGAIAVVVSFGQIIDLNLDRWRGDTEARLTMAESLPPANRGQIVRQVETEAAAKIIRNERSAPWLWRIIGRARLLAGAYGEAEGAFRRSSALEPHEEAEMGLGLALAGQGRTTEAVHHLARACRVNPVLLGFISQEDLRESVSARIRSQRNVTR